MKKVFLLIPLLSLFVFGCNDSQNDSTKLLALLASSQSSSSEESEEVDGYVVYPTIPEGTYGDWVLTKDTVTLTKKGSNEYKKYLNVHANNGNGVFSLRFVELKDCVIKETVVSSDVARLDCECHFIVSLTDSVTTESDQISLLCYFGLGYDFSEPSKIQDNGCLVRAFSLDSGYENNIDNATLDKILQASAIVFDSEKEN